MATVSPPLAAASRPLATATRVGAGGGGGRGGGVAPARRQRPRLVVQSVASDREMRGSASTEEELRNGSPATRSGGAQVQGGYGDGGDAATPSSSNPGVGRSDAAQFPSTVTNNTASQLRNNAKVRQEAKDRLIFFAKLLERVAKEVFGARRSWRPWIPRLTT